LEGASPVFWFAAIFGSVFFLLRVTLLIFGGFGADADGSGETGHGGGDAHEGTPASDAAFKLLAQFDNRLHRDVRLVGCLNKRANSIFLRKSPHTQVTSHSVKARQALG
jgi:hypothetical protein